jgi:hypothetical protein
VNAEAVNEQTPLVRRLAAHLGGDPSTMPVVAEEFEHRALNSGCAANCQRGQGYRGTHP